MNVCNNCTQKLKRTWKYKALWPKIKNNLFDDEIKTRKNNHFHFFSYVFSNCYYFLAFFILTFPIMGLGLNDQVHGQNHPASMTMSWDQLQQSGKGFARMMKIQPFTAIGHTPLSTLFILSFTTFYRIPFRWATHVGLDGEFRVFTKQLLEVDYTNFSFRLNNVELKGLSFSFIDLILSSAKVPILLYFTRSIYNAW